MNVDDYTFFCVDDCGGVMGIKRTDVRDIMKRLDEMEPMFFLYRASDNGIEAYSDEDWFDVCWFGEFDEIDSK